MANPALPEGTTIGGFVIEGVLGRGGMGAVYRARSPRGEAVALKLMADEDAEDLVARERFKREAAAATTVVHPNVIRALGAGEHGRSLWIAFELAPGGSLADLMKRGPLPWRDAARLGAQIARALEAIHAAGVVHRDLKPGNVLLDDAGQAKLTDFGIARNQLGTGHALTRTGELIGTPEYLAPEQIDRARSVDGRADLYSLGVVLHALVSGAPPFVGNALTVMKAQMSKPAPPLPRTVSAPADFAVLVARLLEKDPARRPQGAGEVARALDAIAAGQGARSKAPLVAIGGLLVAALAAALAFTRRPSTAPPPPPPAPIHLDAPPPPPPPPVAPSWFLALPEDERPRLPLPAGVSFGKRPHEYVATRDPTLVLVFVPGGAFDMGDDQITNIANRLPVHHVSLRPFFIGKYEVTIGQFRRFVTTLAAPLPREKWGYFDRTPTRADEAGESDPKGGTKKPITVEDVRTFPRFAATKWTWEHPYPDDDDPTPADEGESRPVTQVTAQNALAYAAWLGLELPTEARWEFAAAWDRKAKQRVGRFAWGDTVPGGLDASDGKLANLIDHSLVSGKRQNAVFGTYDDGARYAADVGSFPKDRSPAGVYDMTGNVREICRDLYDERFYERSPAQDPECTDGNEDDVRVVRGGSWGWHGGTDGGALSLAVRDPMAFASNVIGFRVAASAP